MRKVPSLRRHDPDQVRRVSAGPRFETADSQPLAWAPLGTLPESRRKTAPVKRLSSLPLMDGEDSEDRRSEHFPRLRTTPPFFMRLHQPRSQGIREDLSRLPPRTTASPSSRSTTDEHRIRRRDDGGGRMDPTPRPTGHSAIDLDVGRYDGPGSHPHDVYATSSPRSSKRTCANASSSMKLVDPDSRPIPPPQWLTTSAPCCCRFKRRPRLAVGDVSSRVVHPCSRRGSKPIIRLRVERLP
jgi:hypothetical protein